MSDEEGKPGWWWLTAGTRWPADDEAEENATKIAEFQAQADLYRSGPHPRYDYDERCFDAELARVRMLRETERKPPRKAPKRGRA